MNTFSFWTKTSPWTLEKCGIFFLFFYWNNVKKKIMKIVGTCSPNCNCPTFLVTKTIYLTCHVMVFPACRKDAVPNSSSGGWGGSCSSCCQPRWSDCYHPIQQHSTGTWPILCSNKNLNGSNRVKILCLFYFPRVLLRKQHMDLWQMRTEFSQTFMAAMTGGYTPDVILMC